MRECLAIRDQKTPDEWRTFEARSRLGGSPLGQKKYTAADPLLLQGYQGMKAREARIPAPHKQRLAEAGARVVALYDARGNGPRTCDPALTAPLTVPRSESGRIRRARLPPVLEPPCHTSLPERASRRDRA
jgi:hypothetical protein